MIMVTGGAGYIGSFTVKELLKNGYEVLVVDSMESGHTKAIDSRAKLEIADIGDKEKMRQLFDNYKIEAVIDFAAYLAVGESMENPKKYMKNNVENFLNLLDIIKEAGCRYIIKSSTSSTYGNPEDKYFPLQENYQNIYKPSESALLDGIWEGKMVEGEEFFKDFIGNYEEIFKNRSELNLTDKELARLRIPASIYGLTKLIDEIFMEKYDQLYGIKGIALRYFNVCGASEDFKMGEDKPKPTTLMTLVIMSILGKTQRLQVFGNDYPTKDGTGIRDYIHPLDLATGHVRALKYLMETEQSNIFNLGTGNGYTVMEVIEEVQEASGRRVDYEVVGRRSGDPAQSWADAGRAEKLLGWKAQYNLSDMARTAWEWHSRNPEGYESVSSKR